MIYYKTSFSSAVYCIKRTSGRRTRKQWAKKAISDYPFLTWLFSKIQEHVYISYSPFPFSSSIALNNILFISLVCMKLYIISYTHTHTHKYSFVFVNTKSEILIHLVWGKMWALLLVKADSYRQPAFSQSRALGPLPPCSLKLKPFSWPSIFLSPGMSQHPEHLLVPFPAHHWLPLIWET